MTTDEKVKNLEKTVRALTVYVDTLQNGVLHLLKVLEEDRQKVTDYFNEVKEIVEIGHMELIDEVLRKIKNAGEDWQT